MREECDACQSDRAEVSIAFVGPARIRELNKTYRGIDRETDVLSFAESGEGKLYNNADKSGYIGEIVICMQVVKRDAKDLGVSVKQELAWVIVHGMLHLFGYDHESGKDEAAAMRQKEEYYLLKSAKFVHR